MKRIVTLLFAIMLLMAAQQTVYAQLTGVKTIPGDYASISVAIVDLNVNGVGAGGVTFNIAAGYTETAMNLAITTTTGSASSPIVFRKSGAGANPLITADITGTSTTVDGIFKLVGADYVTIDGIDLIENPANVTTTAQAEWGYALLKIDGTNGCQNDTIRNCTVTLNKTNNNTVGIYSGNHTTANTTDLIVTATSGANSNNKFFSNTISNAFSGIRFLGYNHTVSPYQFYDQGNEVGTAAGLQNKIFNYGGGATNTAYGVYGIYQNGIKIFNTNINSTGGTWSKTTLYGIFLSTGLNANVDIFGDTVTVSDSGTTSQLAGIFVSMGGSGTNNTVNINNNVVTNCAYPTSAASTVYYINAATSIFNLNIFANKVTNNVVGSATATAAATVNYIYTTGGLVSNGHWQIYNNTISGNSRVQSANGGGTISGIYSTGATPTISYYGNTIENNTWQTTGVVQSIYNISTPSLYNCYNNTVRNNSFSGTSTGTFYGIYHFNSSAGGTANIYNNGISNFTSGGATLVYGIYSDPVGTTIKSIYQDTIYGLNSNGGAVYGIRSLTAASNQVHKNKIYNLSTTSSTAYGMYIDGGTTNNVYNNFVSDLRATTSTNVNAVAGIFLNAGTTDNVFDNTVYLNAVSTSATTFGTSGIHAVTTPTADLRNNLVVNNSTAGPTGGFTVAYRRSTTTLTTYSSNSNNNNFYAGANTRRAIFYDGTNADSTLATYKTRVTPRDNNAINENTAFVNTASTPYDLHISPSIATQCESGALVITSPIAITTDYDNNTRNATNPDIGADEGNFILLDASAPVISYTALTHTNSTANRNLTATITDGTAVDTSLGNGPLVYYKKGALGTYKSGKYVSRAGTSFTFTIRTDSLGGLAINDTVLYYVAAQDVVGPNVSTNPAGGSGVNPPGTTAPSSPNKYFIVDAPLSGTYTVGLNLFNRVSGKNLVIENKTRTVKQDVVVGYRDEKGQVTMTSSQTDTKAIIEKRDVTESYQILTENGAPYVSDERADITAQQLRETGYTGQITDDTRGIYPTITAAVNDLTLRGVQGAVILSLVDATYPTETYPITLNSVSGVSASNTITIKPAPGVTSTVSGASASGPMFRVLNTSYVTIDGSNSGGTTRDLTFTNTSVTSPSVVGFGSTGTTPFTNAILKNCNLINGATTSSAVVVSDAAVWGNPGYFSNVTIQNNSIQKAYIGVYSNGGTSPQNGSNLSYINNTLTTTGANQMRYTGLYMQGVNGATVSGNSIGNFEGVNSEADKGMWLASGTINAVVEKNKIDSLIYTGTGGYGGQGMWIAPGVLNANIVVRNNMISNLRGDGWSYTSVPTDNTMGIGLPTNSTQSGISVYNNSIYLSGNTLNQSLAMSMGIYLGLTVTADIRNNVIVNNLGLLSATGYGSVGIYVTTAASQITGINYNDYFVNPSGTGVKALGQIVSTASITLAAWRTATGGDRYSISADPQFTSFGDLHINTGIATPVERAGQVIAGVTTDFDGNTRDLNYPDMGADEGSFLVQDLTPPVITYNLLTSPGEELDRTSINNKGNDLDNNNGFRALTATITDNTQLQTSLPNAPRVYYKKGALGTYKFGNPVSASGNDHTFNILYNDSLGGVTAGDSIFYYVAAQDTASNMITSPYGGSGANPPGTTAPASVNFFRVASTPAAVTLSLPANGSALVSRTPLFDWSDAVGAKFYRIQVATDAGFTNIVKDTNGILVSQFQLTTALSASTQYFWKISATNEGGQGSFTGAFSFFTVPPPPVAPTLISPANNAINVSVTPTLDWSDVSDNERGSTALYRLQVATDTGFTSIVKDTSGLTTSSFGIGAGVLGGNTKYYWRVNGTNPGGTGPYASAFNFTTVPAAPSVPVLVSPSNGATDVALMPLMNWNDVASATEYRIQIATDAAFTSLIKDTSGILTSQYQVLNGALSTNTVYYWRASATNPGGSSALSSAFSFTTVPNAPVAPTLIAPANNAVNVSVNPTFDWSDVVLADFTGGKGGSETDAVTLYRLQLSTDSTFATTLKDTNGIGASTYTLPGAPLANNTKYFWRVRASNPGGNGVFTSEFRFTTIVSAPAAPVLTAPANNAVNVSVTPLLDWNDAAGATSYRVQISTDSLFATTLKDSSGLPTSQFQVAASVLAINTKYYWRVSATNAGGTSAFTAKFAFTTIPPAPGVPVLLTPANNAFSVPLAPLFDWNDVSGATGYRIQISTDSAFGTSLKDTSGVLTSQYQIPGGLLAINTRYYWRVSASNPGGNSAFAARFTFTTAPPPPAQVTFTIIPGGLYNTSTGRLNMRDSIKVYLVDSANCLKVDSSRGVLDSVTFSTTLNFTNASTGNYYLFVYHRNHVALATKLTQSIVRGSTVSYNFTTDSAKAFGNNMVKVSPVLWAMIPGDANRDGFVDGLDQTVWILQNGLDGYYAADLNGDGFVDGLDQTIWIFANGQGYVLPCNILDQILNIKTQETISPANVKVPVEEQKKNLQIKK